MSYNIMQTNNYRSVLMGLAALGLLASGCRKKDDPVIVDPPPTQKEVHINFVNFAGNDSLKLNTTTYTNSANEQFTVSIFNYYISNVRLIAATGNDYVEKESYHLVKEGINGSRHFHLEDVPQGDYKAISFVIGVDSAKNVSGAQAGALDASNGMFWDWNTGYIMAKMEGSSNASTTSTKTFKYHTGGFKGENNVLRTVQLDFPVPISVKGEMSGDVAIKADLLKWFGPETISIATVNTVMMPGADAVKLANNYSKMFSIIKATTTNE
ncbi:MbnP family protein [Polluticoccus soli]|uniref:MbnP family protein n=1 Tax=Polluticoccus soli TaxID=3034150 RepID=UPI0023E2FD52|nr:MbnP family protein [Flavipsychrobacter sp. JY13-12]